MSSQGTASEATLVALLSSKKRMMCHQQGGRVEDINKDVGRLVAYTSGENVTRLQLFHTIMDIRYLIAI